MSRLAITLAAIVTILLSLSVVVVNADTLVYEVAALLVECNILFCTAPQESGVSATIQQSSTGPASGEGIAFWVSMDWYNCCSAHEWLQSGIVYGQAPNGVFYNGPEYYLEYQTSSTYQFTPLGSADTNPHTFLVSDTPGVTDPTATVEIDGIVKLSMKWAISGVVAGGAEVHLPSGMTMPGLSATFSNLKFLYSANNWQPFNYAGVLASFSYQIAETCGGPVGSPNGGASFTVSVSSSALAAVCGGGGGEPRREMPPSSGQQLLSGVGAPKGSVQVRTDSPAIQFLAGMAALVPVLFLARRHWKKRSRLTKGEMHRTRPLPSNVPHD